MMITIEKTNEGTAYILRGIIVRGSRNFLYVV
jgi:hypothetical protein